MIVVGVVVAAPLAAGGVHRESQSALMAGAALGACLAAAAAFASRGGIRAGAGAIVPIVFLAVAIVQSLPFPAGVSDVLDSAGRELLAGSPAGADRLRPLSLDPSSTRVEIGKAGAALAVYLAAFHMASGKERGRRMLVCKAVAAAGLAAWLVGIGHKVLGVDLIYGRFVAGTGLLVGPFVNPNHTAELMEIAAFAAAACASAATSRGARIGWTATAIVAAAAALATLSRGSVLALGAGGAALAIAWWRRTPPEERGRDRSTFQVVAAVVVMAAVAATWGAGALVEDVVRTRIGSETKVHVWAESLRLVKAHPAGVGRGVFDRIFPAYRQTAGPERFAFVENQPLHLLVEMGWVGFAALLVAVGWTARKVARRGRGDAVEAALVAGVAAVFVHNLVDFGLETLGIILPFCAVLAVLLGRRRDGAERRFPRGRTFGFGLVASAAAAAAVGIVALRSPTPAELDASLRKAPSASAYRAVAARAAADHPVDYYYALAWALSEPIEPDETGRSPRLRALNRALRLCPACAEVHREVARALWQLGRRAQSLGEWRAAVRLSPAGLWWAFEELRKVRASPDELASLSDQPDAMLDLASYLAGQSMLPAARDLLGRARASAGAGVSGLRALLIQAEIDLRADDLAAARASLDQAGRANPREPRVFLMQTDVETRAGSLQKALAILEAGVAVAPTDLSLQRKRLEMAMAGERWDDAERALGGLRSAIAAGNHPAGEAHVMAARLHVRRDRGAQAIGEYRIALTLEPANSGIWRELAAAAEQAGRLGTALEAYREVVRLLPGDAAAAADLARLEGLGRALGEARTLDAGHDP